MALSGTFHEHLEQAAHSATPPLHPAQHESVDEFFIVSEGTGEQLTRFEPTPQSGWFAPGYAAAAAYRVRAAGDDNTHPFVLATYVEGDVTIYRFRNLADAERAGHLWASGLA